MRFQLSQPILQLFSVVHGSVNMILNIKCVNIQLHADDVIILGKLK